MDAASTETRKRGYADLLALADTPGNFRGYRDGKPIGTNDDGTPFAGTTSKCEALDNQEPHGPPITLLEITKPTGQTEETNGRRLAWKNGHDFRWVEAWDSFLTWDGKRWARDDRRQMDAWMKEIHRSFWQQMWDEVAEEFAQEEREGKLVPLTEADEKKRKAILDKTTSFIKASGSDRGIRAAINLSRSEPDICQPATAFDHDDTWLLNLQNGTLDLKSFTLRPHSRGDLITKLAPIEFTPGARCQRWTQFIDEITQHDNDLAKYLQLAAGLSLTGDTSEHVLLVCHGKKGRNGKSTFLRTLKILLGLDYAIEADSNLLIQKKGNVHSTERMDLAGKRMVCCIETEQNQKFAEGFVKALTGGDSIRGRRIQENTFEYEPTHKIWLATNYRPAIRGTDGGIWERVKLIPFDASYPEGVGDTELPATLLTELPGILNWAIEGLKQWHEIGLRTPTTVKVAVQGYQEEMDSVGKFLEKQCDLSDPNSKTACALLFAAYKKFFGTRKSNDAMVRRNNGQ